MKHYYAEKSTKVLGRAGSLKILPYNFFTCVEIVMKSGNQKQDTGVAFSEIQWIELTSSTIEEM